MKDISPSTTMPEINITSIRTSSNGVWQGDNPLEHAFPLLIVQTTLILAVSRFLAFLLKPLRQPKVIAEIAVTLQEVQFMLQSQEMRLEQLNLSTPSDYSTPSANLATQLRKSLTLQGFNGNFSNPLAHNFNSNRGRGRGRWIKNNRPLCQLCNRPGHIALKCYHQFDISFQGQHSSNTPSSNDSFPGQQQFTKPGQQAYYSAANITTPDNAWYLDSGATNHVTADPSNLYHKTEYKADIRPSQVSTEADPVSPLFSPSELSSAPRDVSLSPSPSPSIHPHIPIPQSTQSTVSLHPMTTRSKSGIFKPKTYIASLLRNPKTQAYITTTPTSVQEALSIPSWKKAMDEEFSSVTYFLGFETTRGPNGIHLSQAKYTCNIQVNIESKRLQFLNFFIFNLNWVFPKWSTPILESVASVGLLFFLFLVGLELDMSSIRRSGKRAFGIAVAGISLPFVCGVAVAFVLRKTIKGEDQVGYSQFLVFIGVALSTTAFPVLSRILAELKLLTTQVGETAMAAAAFNDVTAWILLALAVALAGNEAGGEHKSPLISIWVLISGGAFVAIMLTVIRSAMKWVSRRFSSRNNMADEAYICFTLAGVVVSGFITDLIGIHSIFGAFVLNDESFAILVLMALFTTFITTPTVLAIYKPARGGSSTSSRRKLGDLTTTKDTKDELRILACAHGSGNVPTLISLVESTRSTKNSQLKLYIMHLVELTERSSSIIMVQRVRKNGLPFLNQSLSSEWHDRVTGEFQAYSQYGRVSARTMTSISNLTTMHEDICHVGENKKVALIILPFHLQWRGEGDQAIMDNVGHGWRGVNQRVLKNAPCSVAVLVDRGFGNGSQISEANTNIIRRVCIMFFGGPDDREALELGGRMGEHPAVKVTIELDETAMAEFKSKWEGTVEYTENEVSNIVEAVLAIGRSGDYDLIVVGKGRFPSKMVAELAYRQAEHAELGPIGDILASSGHGVVSSVLVIQQHDLAHANEAPVSKTVRTELEKSADESCGVGEIARDAM
ncbi:hypothetical protein DKX38_009130 [Salix brachista]|uniref:Uncharacterized protein n=1 Tax=Salix brachista TaxID=2182728 RepID=A0A5N5M9Z2_9ROSI|nr:hypothetical protein DKX38_009130 [Salix brachista]